MKIMLLCKGPGSKLIKPSTFNGVDKYAWANLPVFENGEIDLPKKIDILYLRKLSSYTELTPELKEMYDTVGIKKLISSGDNFKKAGKYKVERRVNPLLKNLNRSTGLVAFADILKNYKPKEFIIAGLDLFEKGKPIYFFNFSKNITNKRNSRGLQKEFLSKDGFTVEKELSFHSSTDSLNYIYDTVKNNPSTNFTYLTTNIKIKEKLEVLQNIKIITE